MLGRLGSVSGWVAVGGGRLTVGGFWTLGRALGVHLVSASLQVTGDSCPASVGSLAWPGPHVARAYPRAGVRCSYGSPQRA